MTHRYGDDRDVVDRYYEKLYKGHPKKLAAYWRKVRGEEPVQTSSLKKSLDAIERRRVAASDSAAIAAVWNQINGIDSQQEETSMSKATKAPKSPLVKAAKKAAKVGDDQKARAMMPLLYREAVAKERAAALKAIGSNSGSMARAIRTASNPAVRRATKPGVSSFGRNPADALRAVIRGTMQAEEVPESVLAATRRQVDAHRQDSAADMIEIEGEIEALKGELAKALGERDAGAASRAEQISYQLSRKQLILGHRQGVI